MHASLDHATYLESRHLSESSLVSAGYSRHHFAPHAHRTFGIGIIDSGVARATYLGKECQAERHDMITVNPGDVHTGRSASSAEPWRYRMLFLSPRAVHRIAADLGFGLGRQIRLQAPVIRNADLASRVRRLLDTVAAGQDPTSDHDPLHEAFDLLFRGHSEQLDLPRTTSEPAGVTDAQTFLRAHLREKVSVSDAARHVGFSTNYLTRLFRQSLGLTPHAWLLQERVERAGELLRSGAPAADVAYAVGFNDQSHLTRRFKRVVGVTPGEFSRGALRSSRVTRA